MAYTLHTEYRFTVCNQEFAVRWLDNHLYVEETRKNGQEDCHLVGYLNLRAGKWEWEDEYLKQHFNTYGNDGVADAIPAYINANPVPK